MPFVAVDFIGFWIPKYDFSGRSRSLISQTAIMIGLIAMIFKIIRYFTIDLYYNYEEHQAKKDRRAAVRRRNKRNSPRARSSRGRKGSGARGRAVDQLFNKRRRRWYEKGEPRRRSSRHSRSRRSRKKKAKWL